MYFRASTAERANALSLRGFVENSSDGTVLVLAAGETAALAELIAWLHQGPPMAGVESVEVESIEPASLAWPAGFHPK